MVYADVMFTDNINAKYKNCISQTNLDFEGFMCMANRKIHIAQPSRLHTVFNYTNLNNGICGQNTIVTTGLNEKQHEKTKTSSIIVMCKISKKKKEM